MVDNETKTVHAAGARPAPAPASLPGPHLEAGATVGRYVVLYRVGFGGMAVVYAAFDPELDRKVALKILRSDLSVGDRHEIPKREARAMARLRHPNVVAVYDLGAAQLADQTAVTFLAMEFVDGRDLGAWLAEHKRDWREVVELFMQAGRGLAAAHAEGLLHLDFKPSNVMVARGRQARVSDFGLAQPIAGKHRDAGASPLGTPAYLAPERWDGGRPDARSDQFSFCAALYLALFGQLPFAADPDGSPRDAIRAGRIQPPPPGHGVPSFIVQSLWRGLRADREERFPDLDALLSELSPRRRRRRRRTWAAGLGALILAGLAAGSLLLQPGSQAPCAGGQERMRGVWDESLRRDVRLAFSRHALPFARATLAWIEDRLDRYSADWLAMYTDACEATHVRGEQSERLLDRRMLCLDDRLEELRAQAAALTRIDGEAALRAGDAVAGLRSVAACGDRAALDRLNLPELDAAAQAELAAARAVTEAQHVRHRVGERVDAGALEQSLLVARRLRFPQLEARIHQLQSYLAYLEGDLSASRNLFFEALRAAKTAADDRLEIQVLAELAEAEAVEPADFEQARRWLELGEATLASLRPGPDASAVYLEQSAGWVAWHASDYPQAEARFRRALEVAEGLWGPKDVRLAAILTDLSNTLQTRGDPEQEALTLVRRSVEIREQAFGRSNPKLGPSLVSWAASLAEQGRYDPALETVRRAVTVTRDFYGEDFWELAYPQALHGQILLAMDRPDDAIGPLEHSRSLVAGTLGADHPIAIPIVLALGEARILQRRLDDAARLAAEVAALELPEGHPQLAVHAFVVGRIHLDRGEPRQGERWLRRARELATLPLPESTRVALEVGLGIALLERGRLDEAEAQLAGALERVEGRDHHLLAEARFGLARVLELRGDVLAAADQARRAHEEIGTGSSRSRWLRGQIEVLLARQGAAPRPAAAQARP